MSPDHWSKLTWDTVSAGGYDLLGPIGYLDRKRDRAYKQRVIVTPDVIRQLERLQRQSARVVCKKYKNDHTSVTELMWGLHWLPIRARIQYKILLLVYKAFTNGSPTYLADMMTSCNPVRSTRSSHKVNLLVVPHQKSNKYSEKAFAVVGPRLWNELLTDELRGCNSVDTFKKKLKTMLFKKHY